jgi:AcrR family transcriptional regulator
LGRPRGGSRQRVVAAAFEVLRRNGYAGASTRAIAAAGGFQPGLIFYYFASLDELLVAALAESSEGRLERYRTVVAEAGSLSELVAILGQIYRDDVDSGHIRVVSELVGASISRPELAGPVVALMEPWVELAERAIDAALAGSPIRELVTARELALAAVTFYLGANLLTQLLPDRNEVSVLLEDGGRLAPALALIEGLAKDAAS